MILPADSGVLNVKTGYGAVGNGVADDTAAIYSAIAAIPAYTAANPFNRSIIYFPAGTYLVSPGTIPGFGGVITRMSSFTVSSFTWSSTNGGQVTVVMAAAMPSANGGAIYVSGITGNTGSGGNPNGKYFLNTWTDSQHFTFLLPGTGAQWGTFSGTIVCKQFQPCLVMIGEDPSNTTIKLVDNATGFNNVAAPNALIFTASGIQFSSPQSGTYST